MRKNFFISKKYFLSLILSVFFIFGAAIFRVLPHPFNFTPLVAIALFGGVYLPKKLAFLVPVLVMLASDFFLGFYQLSLMAFVYLPFVMIVILGFWLKSHKKWYNVISFSIISSSLFFLVSNFGFWLFTSFYPKTLSGIFNCYVAAIPFFKNTLLGSLFYVIILFGSYELLNSQIKRLIIMEKSKKLLRI